MKIQQYKSFEFESKFNEYGFFGNLHYQNSIWYVQMFFHYCYGYVRRAGGPIQFFDSLKHEKSEWGMTFEMVDVNIDPENEYVYLGEVFDPYEHDMTEQEFKIKYNNMTDLQLCQNNIVDCAVMTKDNFIHLLTAWEKLLNTMSPFVLLYLDDQGWYDLLPFDSKEAMENFVEDHTEQEVTI